jgi:hypothetical protein
MAAVKKRKFADKNPASHNMWTESYFFTCIKSASVCIVDIEKENFKRIE